MLLFKKKNKAYALLKFSLDEVIIYLSVINNWFVVKGFYKKISFTLYKLSQ